MIPLYQNQKSVYGNLYNDYLIYKLNLKRILINLDTYLVQVGIRNSLQEDPTPQWLLERVK